MYIAIIGSFKTDFRFVGPFETRADAWSYANWVADSFEIVSLEKPRETL